MNRTVGIVCTLAAAVAAFGAAGTNGEPSWEVKPASAVANGEPSWESEPAVTNGEPSWESEPAGTRGEPSWESGPAHVVIAGGTELSWESAPVDADPAA
ncbi:hypothetical protein [Streptomyces genisteinicus]|uniref:5'-nucleotidase n=1 Tax=Streptomyces genisteinicus TaxID=2768068 RepID=A0A7H0HUY4_9ACTN|nr:hypothetical protein [Streptomyces genisteinicus]QNP64350.1 hypothetical protein IAG43_16510 [Streptomyces genisteinicus]